MHAQVGMTECMCETPLNKNQNTNARNMAAQARGSAAPKLTHSVAHGLIRSLAHLVQGLAAEHDSEEDAIGLEHAVDLDERAGQVVDPVQ